MAKILYFHKISDVEVGGFGISFHDNPLSLNNFCLVKQKSSMASTDLDDDGIADFFDDCIDEGLEPVEFGRIWIHTHPQGIGTPSTKDEKTFSKCFGKCDWAIMMICPEGAKPKAWIQYKFPACRMELDVEVDYSIEFPASEHDEWKKEFDECVEKEVFIYTGKPYTSKYSNKPGAKENFCTPYSAVEEDWDEDWWEYWEDEDDAEAIDKGWQRYTIEKEEEDFNEDLPCYPCETKKKVG
jgi:proteasome lid subunit RPN8/RPN11